MSARPARQSPAPLSKPAPGSIQFVRAKQVAERLGLSPKEVYRLVHDGHLPHVWAGRSGAALLIPADAVDTYLANLRHDADLNQQHINETRRKYAAYAYRR